jgi:hypothetical protein
MITKITHNLDELENKVFEINFKNVDINLFLNYRKVEFVSDIINLIMTNVLRKI